MCSSKGHISEVVRPITSLDLGEEMTDKDFKHIEDIQRLLKYLDKGKLDKCLVKCFGVKRKFRQTIR